MDTKGYVPGKGPIGAELMVIGEAPSYNEVEQGEPFVGASGRELNHLCKDAGIPRNACWVSNVCKYFVPPSPKGKRIPFAVRAKQQGINLEQQLDELRNEINSIKPNTILALGETALWGLTGKKKITKQRGSILLGMGRKVIPTFHPAHLLHTADVEIKGYWNRQLMIFDFQRAFRQSKFPELILPRRILRVAKNSAELQDFLDRHRGYTRPAVDIEGSKYCVPTCIGIAFTPKEGMTVPLWNEHGYSHIPTSDLVSMWGILAKFLMENEIIGQNFKYDQDKIRRIGFTIKKLISDTMLKGFAIFPELPKNLAFYQSIYTEEPFYKDEGMYEGSIEDLFLGCARDACVTKEIDMAMDKDLDELGLRPFYENFLMHLHGAYLDVEDEGFNIDTEARDELFHKYITWDERLTYELFKLVGTVVNVNSPKQVATLLFDNLGLPKRAGTGEEELTALLAVTKSEEHRSIMEKILEQRRVKRTIANNLMAIPDYDGKMKTTYFICLDTGRTSTGQQEAPIRPTIKIDKKNKSMGTPFQTMTKHGDIGADIRKQYIPENGYVFVNADSSQAEARVVALLADDEETLAMYDTNDIHALTASWFFGGTEADYSKRVLGYEHPTRFVGKTLRHAGHLGMKKRTASISVNTDARKYKIPITITEAQAEVALKIFHSKAPKVRAIFHEGIIKQLEKDRSLTAPLPYGIDAPFGGKRTFFERWGDELFRQAYSYIPQRAVSDNTKCALLRIRARAPWIRVILESHDALLCMVWEGREQEAGQIIKEEMERPIDFSQCSLSRRSLIIPCELEIGVNYLELKKFKLEKAA